ncbi:MAG: carbamoyltransferase HypF [Gammaproteobacteria bacterium]
MNTPEPDGRAPAAITETVRLVVAGQVQAVGFRPFVYRLAIEHDLSGWIRNRTGTVEIIAIGTPDSVQQFERDLLECAPPLARPEIELREAADAVSLDGFQILDSESGDAPRVFVPPDFYMCRDCEHELATPSDRRYRYPFINCTQCGPRYTLIRAMPYDRAQTTMAAFDLCSACLSEYSNPADRRFHAEPLACPECGPSLEFAPNDGTSAVTADALSTAVAALHAGKIVAVKGIGGYHLMCDARNETAVATLRARKPRPDKPLAVMFPTRGTDGLEDVRRCVDVDTDAAATITSPVRPIVLLPKRTNSDLADGIAPGLAEVGVFLPYSPLHELLLGDFGGPLVATSGNVTGEPVLTDNEEAAERLSRVADAFLHHDRPIARPAEDAVYRRIANVVRPIRPGRGQAPLELKLPRQIEKPVIALGGHLKSTVALAWDSRVVVSPHVGDMDSPRALRILRQVAKDIQSFYGVDAEAILCDMHPGYATSRWAREQQLPTHSVLHHHAHASALAGEAPDITDWLVFAWDGVGMGEDGSLWGGETLHGRPGAWQRAASLKSFLLPGGDIASREPWRSAAAVCWEIGTTWNGEASLPDVALVHQAWMRGLNCHETSAAGRLFDAAASLILGVHRTSFEGQGPMQLEAMAAEDGPLIELPLEPDNFGVLRADWRPLVPMLTDKSIARETRAAGFHRSLATAIANIAANLSETRRIERVGLTGGVFQNDKLARATIAALAGRGFDTLLPETLPCNDAGLSYGQVIDYAAQGFPHD